MCRKKFIRPTSSSPHAERISMKKSIKVFLVAAFFIVCGGCKKQPEQNPIDILVYNNTLSDTVKITDRTTSQLLDGGLAAGTNRSYRINADDCLTYEQYNSGVLQKAFDKCYASNSTESIF